MAPTRPTIDRTKALLMDPNALATEHVAVVNWYRFSFTVDPAKLVRMIMQAPRGMDHANIAQFMSSQFDDIDDSQGSQWEAHRVLGQGGFGTGGYWRKLNKEGDTVDEVAIKEQIHFVPHTHLWAHFGETMTMRERGIAEEAVFHAGLQVKEATAQAAIGDNGFANEVERSGHIPPLRAYKYLEKPKKSRMYLCFAPHGTLQDILWLYAANNQRVPETFA